MLVLCKLLSYRVLLKKLQEEGKVSGYTAYPVLDS